jgi:23S rRNA pseudoU1915 N3-methylase RlmH
MHHGGTGRRCLDTLMAGLLLTLIAAAPDVLAGEWEKMRESYDNKLRAYEKRIAEIEAKERGIPANREKRADTITRDRVTRIRASLKGSGKGKSLAETAEQVSSEAMALVDVYREQSEHLDIVMREWGAEGVERKKLRDAITAWQKSLERVNANLAGAAEAAGATIARVQESGVLEKVARIEEAIESSEAGERLRARWQRERAAQERQREQREREAAERARSLR